MKILLRNCDQSENVNLFLHETLEQESQDSNDLDDSLLEQESEKQGNLILYNFLLLVQFFLLI